MCNFKISKKDPLSDTRSSILDLHERKLNFYDSKKSQLDTYKRELSELLNEESSKNRDRIYELQSEIHKIENDTELNDYLLDFIDIIYKNNRKLSCTTSENKGVLDTYINSHIINDKTELYNEYIKKFNPDLKQVSETKKQEERICKRCNSSMFIYDAKNSDETCKNCGNTKHVLTLDDHGFLSLENNENNFSLNYKRNNHFQECLNQLQAKENTTIPPKIIKDLTLEFKKYNITNPKLITYSLVKEYLRKLKYNKYYEHIPTIINEICGLKAPVLTQELEQQLKIMFDQIQGPFDKHSKIICPERKNFLNYNFVFYKMCQILHKDEFLILFPLLKSREKLYEHDQIWKGICKELNWDFIPSI